MFQSGKPFFNFGWLYKQWGWLVNTMTTKSNGSITHFDNVFFYQ